MNKIPVCTAYSPAQELWKRIRPWRECKSGEELQSVLASMGFMEH